MTECRYCEIFSLNNTRENRNCLLSGAEDRRVQGKKAGADMSIVDEINQVKKYRNAVILSHYYVNDEVQAIADYVGHSF